MKIFEGIVDLSGEKRCRVDLVARVACPKCGKMSPYDMSENYLSFPQNGIIEQSSVECRNEACGFYFTFFVRPVFTACIEVFEIKPEKGMTVTLSDHKDFSGYSTGTLESVDARGYKLEGIDAFYRFCKLSSDRVITKSKTGI